MTDPLRKAAQALVDALDATRLDFPVPFISPEHVAALRAALASPAPSPSTAAAGYDDGWRAACDYWAKECANTARNAARKPARDEAAGWSEAIRSRRDMPEPAPSPSRDDAVAADHALAPVAVEGMIRDDALEEAARTVDTYAHEAQDWFRETSESRWTTRLAHRVRSLKGQPPTAAPADQSKETP